MADIITVPPAGAPDMSEHDKAMLAKAEGTPVGDPANPPSNEPAPSDDPPNEIPEKFLGENGELDTGKLLDAYRALESKMGRGDNKGKEGDDLSLPDDDDNGGDEGEPSDAPTIDFDHYQKVYEENNGTLPDDVVAEMEKKGLPKIYVDRYLAGLKALEAQLESSIKDAVGGSEVYDSMREHSKANWSAEQKAAYNEAMASGDPTKMRMAAMALKQDYEDSMGKDPKLIHGGKSNDQASSGFLSSAEMTQAMSDPRYQKDPAYRAMVEKKMAATPDSVLSRGNR